MQFQAEMPYPTLDEITKDIATLRIIAPAYAGRNGELTAVLQYVYQSIVFSETGNEEIGKKLMGIAVSEMHHFELLGTAILKLGAPPVFTSCPPYPVGYYSAANVNYSKSPRQMICADICGEENAITEYEHMLCSMKNAPVAALISRIIEDERIHLKVLQEILSSF